MTEKKGFGETVLGWFVVREDDEEDETPEKIIAKYGKKDLPPDPPVPGPARRAPPAPDPKAPPSVALKGEVPLVAAGSAPDPRVFGQVFKAAQITEEAQQRVEKALGLLQSLPTETPKDVRKQIVEASLKAFNIPLDQIIETAAEEIQALEAYIQHGERHTESVLSDASQQIGKLEAQIGEIKKLMELQARTQRGTVKASNDQKLRIQTVLEFFGQEAVARVVRESPKLVEPEKK
ncbi:MAG TPA: hypothetical protein VGI39_18345 [Polyangiaceae bacterium]